MGFRRLRDFNLAMLCKHAWRLVNNPDSLVGQSFKVRYFPNSSFLQAKLGNNPSFIWSSIMETQEIIRRCSRWRVGNGLEILVWKDRWLPDKHNSMVESVPFPYTFNATVFSFLNAQGTEWDVDIIQEIFTDRDAKLILSIPLLATNKDDKLIWAMEENCRFTVKSCYRAITQNLPREEMKTWAKVWKLNLPPKVKVFFWQLCTNCLPTAIALSQKRVNFPQICQVCQDGDEDLKHVFMICVQARQC